MRSVNKVILIGNVGMDPEVKQFDSGQTKVTLSVATSRKWTKDGEPQEKTEWHRVIAWGKTAEFVEQYVRKGDPLYIEGSVEYRSWTDNEGHTRYTTEINAREVVSLARREQGERAERRDPILAAASRPAQTSFEDFPEALDDDDELPF